MKLDGKGTVVEITGLKDASPVIERHRGFHEVMKNYPGIKVVTLDSNWKMERAQELMKQYLDKGGHADGVFGLNWEYDFSKNFQLSGTFQHLSEQPLLTKVTMSVLPSADTFWQDSLTMATK